MKWKSSECSSAHEVRLAMATCLKRKRQNGKRMRNESTKTAILPDIWWLLLPFVCTCTYSNSLNFYARSISVSKHTDSALRSGPRQSWLCHKGHATVRILSIAFLKSSWNRICVYVDEAHTHTPATAKHVELQWCFIICFQRKFHVWCLTVDTFHGFHLECRHDSRQRLTRMYVRLGELIN